MKKKLTVHLDEKLYQRLRDRCGGDEQAMQDFAAKILEEQIPESAENREEKDLKGLEDYLKQGKPGSRSYGIKGQGW